MPSRIVNALSARFPNLPGMTPRPVVGVLRLSGIISAGPACSIFQPKRPSKNFRVRAESRQPISK